MRIPVVIVTALRDKDARLNAVRAGANDFIGKPIDALELRVRLESLLRMKGGAGCVAEPSGGVGGNDPGAGREFGDASRES